MNDDIYDTTLYTDFTDLPKKTQKELYTEFIGTKKEEKTVYRLTIALPAAFILLVFGFMLAALLVLIFQGMGLQFIILLVCVVLVLLGFVIAKLRLDRVKTAHELRFAEWLKTEKHVIAVLKEKQK